MLRAVLIDDEHLALLHLEKILKDLIPIDVVGVFMDADSAISQLPSLQPDVVFLDIQMPETNGLEAAEVIGVLCPSVEIIFVTAYDEHALEAFELNALDYVLKPLNRERLAKTTDRLQRRLGTSTSETIEQPVTIGSFGTLTMTRGQTEVPVKWRTQKAQAIFTILFHHANRFVSKNTLIEYVWPDIEFSKAASYLYTTIYQIRRSLKQARIDIMIEKMSGSEGYCLRLGENINEVEDWERTLRSIEQITPANEALSKEIVELYKEDYLKEYDYHWAIPARERLRSLWLFHTIKLASYYANHGNYTEALQLYKRIIQIHPYHEEAYLNQMIIYDKLGDQTSVELQYQSIQHVLEHDLEIEVSDEIRAWYFNWKNKRAT